MTVHNVNRVFIVNYLLSRVTNKTYQSPCCFDYLKQCTFNCHSMLKRFIMKAIRVAEYGGAEQCKLLTDVAIPSPGPNQVLIKLHAAGVNPVETYIVSGKHAVKPKLPFTPGLDGAGVVSKIGDNVTKFKEGERIYCLRSVTGTYAEYSVVNEAEAFPLPQNISFQQGAALGTPYFTAYRAIFQKAKLRPGETMFVHGASGAVGLACCQIGRAIGARVIGTAGSEAGLKLIKENGANEAFNHKEKGYMDKIQAASNNGQGPDVIIEMLADVNLEEDMRISRLHGRIAIVGCRGQIQVTPRLAMVKELQLLGTFLVITKQEEFEEMNSFFLSGAECGWLKPVVGQKFPLSQAADAQREVIAHSGGSYGKIVLDIEG